MNRLLLFLAILFPVLARAASPAFKGFRATAPLTIASNLNAGTVTYGFSPSGTPTGSKFLRDDNIWSVPPTPTTNSSTLDVAGLAQFFNGVNVSGDTLGVSSGLNIAGGNLTVAVGNRFFLNNATASRLAVFDSSKGLTNVGTMLDMSPTILTNLPAINWLVETRLIATNSATSNLTVNFGTTNTVELWITNNVTFTNWTGLAAGTSANKLIMIRPQLIARGVNWGNLGLSNPGYSVAIATNANNALWTSLTNGKTYALTLTAVSTNIFPTLTLWE